LKFPCELLGQVKYLAPFEFVDVNFWGDKIRWQYGYPVKYFDLMAVDVLL
jgi:hypothetical protein